MPRIIVIPERLQDLSQQCSRQAEALQSVVGHLKGTLNNLDWEARQAANVSGIWQQAGSRGSALADQARAMSQYLARKAQAFAEADQQGVQSVATIAWPLAVGRDPSLLPAPLLIFPIAIVVTAVAIPIIGIGLGIRQGVRLDGRDREQIDGAAEVLKGVKELTPKVWARITVEERLQALQKAEDALAKAQGRPAFRLTIAELKGNTLGQYHSDLDFVRKVCDGTAESITIDDDMLRDDNLHMALSALAHEGRHAYQNYAVSHAGAHPDANQVREWENNFGHYMEEGKVVDGVKVTWEKYRHQPIENDAFTYGDSFADTVSPQAAIDEWWYDLMVR